MAEYAKFGMKVLGISQGYRDSFSHKNSFAVDLRGSGTGGNSPFYAPFTGVVRRVRSANNEVWFESSAPVKWANGTVDYATILMIHADKLTVTEGQIVHQGELLYSEGSKGNVTGAHIHLECAKGKFVAPYGWFKSGDTFKFNNKTYDVWKIYNQVPVHELLFVDPSFTMIDEVYHGKDELTGALIPWVTLGTVPETFDTKDLFFSPTVENLEYFTACDVNTSVLDGPTRYLTVGKQYPVYKKAVAGGYTWYYFRNLDNGVMYWCAMVPNRYTEFTAAYAPLKAKQIRTLANIEYFKYSDVWAIAGRLPANTAITVTKVSVDAYSGFKWYLGTLDGVECYFVANESIELVNLDLFANLSSSIITVNGDNCQYFNTPDVDDVGADNKLPNGAKFEATQRSISKIGDYFWIKFVYTDGKEYYVAEVPDGRVTLSTVDVTPPDGPGDSSDGDYSIKDTGIDVAKFQGEVDWNAVAADAANIKFAMVRCVSSNPDGSLYVDPYFVQNMMGAESAGINRGMYIFTYGETHSEIDAEINLALAQCTGYKFAYPVAWDLEATLFYKKSKAENTELALYALDKIKAAGFYPILYTFTNFASNYVDMDQIAAKYKVWIADYRGYVGYAGAYAIWQYSSSGTVGGINGRVDMNIGYYDFPKYIQQHGYNNYDANKQYPQKPFYGALVPQVKNAEYFAYPSVYAEEHGYLEKDTEYTIVALLNEKYEGFTWYLAADGKYIPYTGEEKMRVDKNPLQIPYNCTKCTDKWIEALKTTKSYAAPSLHANTAGATLLQDRVFVVVAKLTDIYEELEWYVIASSESYLYVPVTSDVDVYDGDPYKIREFADKSLVLTVIAEDGAPMFSIPSDYENPPIKIAPKGRSYRVIGDVFRERNEVNYIKVTNMPSVITDGPSTYYVKYELGVVEMNPCKYEIPYVHVDVEDKKAFILKDFSGVSSLDDSIEHPIPLDIFADHVYQVVAVVEAPKNTLPYKKYYAILDNAQPIYVGGDSAFIEIRDFSVPNYDVCEVPTEDTQQICVFSEKTEYYAIPTCNANSALGSFEAGADAFILGKYNRTDVFGNVFFCVLNDGMIVWVKQSDTFGRYAPNVLLKEHLHSLNYAYLAITANSVSARKHPFVFADEVARLAPGTKYEIKGTAMLMSPEGIPQTWHVLSDVNHAIAYVLKSDDTSSVVFDYPETLAPKNLFISLTNGASITLRQNCAFSDASDSILMQLPGKTSYVPVVGFVTPNPNSTDEWFVVLHDGKKYFVEPFGTDDVNRTVVFRYNTKKLEDCMFVHNEDGSYIVYERPDVESASKLITNMGNSLLVNEEVLDIAGQWYVLDEAIDGKKYVQMASDSSIVYDYTANTTSISPASLVISDIFDGNIPTNARLRPNTACDAAVMLHGTVLKCNATVTANGKTWFDIHPQTYMMDGSDRVLENHYYIEFGDRCILCTEAENPRYEGANVRYHVSKTNPVVTVNGLPDSTYMTCTLVADYPFIMSSTCFVTVDDKKWIGMKQENGAHWYIPIDAFDTSFYKITDTPTEPTDPEEVKGCLTKVFALIGYLFTSVVSAFLRIFKKK